MSDRDIHKKSMPESLENNKELDAHRRASKWRSGGRMRFYVLTPPSLYQTPTDFN